MTDGDWVSHLSLTSTLSLASARSASVELVVVERQYVGVVSGANTNAKRTVAQW